MFKVICTGENECYGKKGEVRELCDLNLMVALKNNWIERKPIEYLGNRSYNRKKLKKPLVLKIHYERKECGCLCSIGHLNPRRIAEVKLTKDESKVTCKFCLKILKEMRLEID